MNSDQLALSLVIAEPGKPSREVKIDSLPCRIGRSSTQPIVLDDAEVSSQHGEFVLNEQGIGFHDLGSLNGTVHNGNPVESGGTVMLKDGDRLQVGKTQIVALIAHRTAPLPAGSTSPSIRLSYILAGLPVVTVTVRAPGQPEQTREFRTMPITIGRTADNALAIEDSEISSQHGRLEVVGDRITFVDLNSLNGTRRNTVRLQPGLAIPLDPGDTLQIGKSEIVVAFTPKRLAGGDVSEAATNQGSAFRDSEPATGPTPAVPPTAEPVRPSLAKPGDSDSTPQPSPAPAPEPVPTPTPEPEPMPKPGPAAASTPSGAASGGPAPAKKKGGKGPLIFIGIIVFLLCSCVCVAGGGYAAVQSGQIPINRLR